MNAALRSLGAAALAASIFAPPFVAASHASATVGEAARPLPAGDDLGRSRRGLAPGVPLATTFDELQAWVADPGGPPAIDLAEAVFRGDLVVKRPVSLRGRPGAVLEGSGTGTVLTIQADDVGIQGMSVRRSGRRSTTEDAGVRATGERVTIRDVAVEDSLFGISLLACHDCLVERSSVHGLGAETELRGDGIKLWESHGSTLRGCSVEDARDVVVWYTRRALVEDNVVRRSRYGTHFMYAHDAVARRNRFERNVVGVFVMYSARVTIDGNVMAGARGPAGMGVGFKESDGVLVRGNWLVANTTGAYLDFTPRTPETPAVLERNVLALNGAALRLHGVERGVRLTANDFRENDETIEVDGGGSARGCEVRGNRFSDYDGYDLDGDGVGDVPYRATALSSALADEHPALRAFHGSVAMGLFDAVARAVPLLEPRVVLLDPAPATRLPEVSAP